MSLGAPTRFSTDASLKANSAIVSQGQPIFSWTQGQFSMNVGVPEISVRPLGVPSQLLHLVPTAVERAVQSF